MLVRKQKKIISKTFLDEVWKFFFQVKGSCSAEQLRLLVQMLPPGNIKKDLLVDVEKLGSQPTSEDDWVKDCAFIIGKIADYLHSLEGSA